MGEELKKRAYDQFSQALQNSNLKNLTEAAYGLLGYPVLINDDWGENLAHAPNVQINDPDYDQLILDECSTSDHFAKFFKRYTDKAKEKDFPMLIYDGDQALRYQMFSVIRFDGYVVGFTSFLIENDKGVSEEEREIIQIFNLFARSIMIAMKEREHVNIQRSNHVLNYLISTDDVETDNYRKNADKLAMRYAGPYIMMMIQCDSDWEQDLFASNPFSIIRKNIHNILFTDMNKTIFILLSGQAVDELQLITEDLKKVMKTDHIHISLSAPFQNLRHIKGYAQQAQLTMEVGFTTEKYRFLYYAKLREPLQIYKAFTDQYLIEPYLNEKVKKILRHDKEKGTEYFDTLVIYVYCFMNVRETARILAVHTNTLHYRLNRLEELFGIDFNNYHLLNEIICNSGLLMMSGIYAPVPLSRYYEERKLLD